VRDPAIFLLDEPLSNLDAKLRARMREEIAMLQRRIGKAMLYVTHDQTEAMTLANRIVIMRDGHVQQIGSPLEVYDRPANAFVAGFIGSPEMNLMPAQAEGDRLHLGEGLSLPAPAGTAPGALSLGIRPEALQLVPPGRAESLPLRIDGIEQLGSQTLYVGALGAHRVRVMTGRRDDIALGAQVAVAAPPAALHLFDRDSGARRPDPPGAP
jgi:ABC-type sugar transport system ATPase subunit